MSTPTEAIDRPVGNASPVAGGRWRVQLLGGMWLRNGDLEFRRFGRRAVTLLFVRLALEPRRDHGREDLALALWPKVAPKIRRKRLSQVLSELRKQLDLPGMPVSTIGGDRDALRLNAVAFDIDTARFERHVRRGEWAAAIDCWPGELLPGLNDPWVQAQRARLAALFERARREAAGGRAYAPQPGEPDSDQERGVPALGDVDSASPALAVPYVTRFLGRAAEIEYLRGAVTRHRLVTLCGPGGGGKTRLAAEVARQVQGFDPVRRVDLAECDQGAAVYERLRAALDLQPTARPALEQIEARLSGLRALLVLDSFERLVGAEGDAVLNSLLAMLPRTHVMLTTRRALRRDDEEMFEVAPLGLPESEAAPAAALHSPAVALFVERARAARSDFNLNTRNVHGVVEVCRLVEGLPLAIELAAAKVRSHAPRLMAQALRRGIQPLARPQCHTPRLGRHASLEATLAWSWHLLAETERRLLRSLTVFRGGWTIEQAHALCPGPHFGRALDALVRDALVRNEPGSDGQARLQMLAVARQFVEELHLPPAQARALRRRHRAHFLSHAQALELRHEWPQDEDLPNLVEALAGGCTDGDLGTASALALALASLWRSRGASEQVLHLLQSIAQSEAVPSPTRVLLHTLLSTLLVNAGQAKAAHEQAALALPLAGADARLRAEAALAQAVVFWRAGRGPQDCLRAAGLVHEAAQLLPAHAAPATFEVRLLLLQGAITLEFRRDPAAAAQLFETAERSCAGLRDRRASLQALPGRVACLLAQERFREAIAVASAGEHQAGELGDVAIRLQLLDRLCTAYQATGRLDCAVQACQSQARLARAHGMPYYFAFAAWNQCLPLAQLGQAEDAVLLMVFARRYWVERFKALTDDDKRYIEQVREQACARIGAARCRALWARGEALSVQEGMDMAARRTPAASSLQGRR